MLKKYFVFIFLLVLALRPTYYVGVVAYYEMHINEIVEKYCVNKNVPELECNGKCHLAKQFSISQDTDETTNSSSVSDISFAFYPLFFQETKSILLNKQYVYNSNAIFNKELKYSYLLEHQIAKPPRRFF